MQQCSARLPNEDRTLIPASASLATYYHILLFKNVGGSEIEKLDKNERDSSLLVQQRGKSFCLLPYL